MTNPSKPNKQDKWEERVDQILLDCEEREAVDEGYDLNEVYCEPDEQASEELKELISSLLSQQRSELIEEVKRIIDIPDTRIPDYLVQRWIPEFANSEDVKAVWGEAQKFYQIKIYHLLSILSSVPVEGGSELTNLRESKS